MSDRLSNETDKAWQAFQDFRDMGTNRTIAELLRQYVQKKKENYIVPSTSDNTLRKWAFENSWNERARTWDAEREKRRVSEKELEDQEIHLRNVEAYREKNRRLAAIAFESSLLIYAEVNKLIKSGNLTPEQVIRLAPYAPKYSETASSAEGTALGVTQILAEMYANK